MRKARALVALFFCLTASIAAAQTGGTFWRLDRSGGLPYLLQFNVDGTWRSSGSVDGSGLFSQRFTQSGANAVASTVDSKLKSLEFNASDWGVIMNSAGADTANCTAINNALLDIDTQTGQRGGLLRLPVGDLYTSCTIDNKYKGITVAGRSKETLHGVALTPSCSTRIMPTFAGTVLKHRTPHGTTSTPVFTGGGFIDLCVDGNSVATRLLEVESVRSGAYIAFLKDSVGTEAALFTGADNCGSANFGEACNVQNAEVDLYIQQTAAGAASSAHGVVLSGGVGSNFSVNSKVRVRGQVTDGNLVDIPSADNNLIEARATILGTGYIVYCRAPNASHPVGGDGNQFIVGGGGSGIYAEGTDTVGATGSVDNVILYTDKLNGTPQPTAGTGSSWRVINRNTDNVSERATESTLAVGDSPTSAGTARTNMSTESVRIRNASSNHLRLENSGGDDWGININASTGKFTISRISGSGIFTVPSKPEFVQVAIADSAAAAETARLAIGTESLRVRNNSSNHLRLSDASSNEWALNINSSNGNFQFQRIAGTGGISFSGATLTGTSWSITSSVATFLGVIHTPGSDPGSPSNGEIWANTGAFRGRLGGSSYTFAMLDLPQTYTALQTFNAGITVSGGTVTIDTPTVIQQTWNNAGTVFTGFKIAITDTASAAGSKPFDITVGGSSVFNVDKTGKTTALQFQATGYIISPAMYGGGTASSTLSLTSTFGTGTTDSVGIYTGSQVLRWKVNTNGHLLAGTDNSYDIGASGATRPRIVYVGTGLNVAGNAGLSVTKTVRASGGAADCTLIYNGGILTGGTC